MSDLRMLTTGQHTLTTQPDTEDAYKHCILVKLTDSSAKAIEEYLKNKVCSHNISNQFNSNSTLEIRSISIEAKCSSYKL